MDIRDAYFPVPLAPNTEANNKQKRDCDKIHWEKSLGKIESGEDGPPLLVDWTREGKVEYLTDKLPHSPIHKTRITCKGPNKPPRSSKLATLTRLTLQILHLLPCTNNIGGCVVQETIRKV